MTTTPSNETKIATTAPVNKTYSLPPEVHAAIVTDRPEMLKILVGSLKSKNRKLSHEEILGLVEMVGDLMADKTATRSEMADLREMLAARDEQVSEALRVLSRNDD